VKEVSENPLAKVNQHRSAAAAGDMKAGDKAMETQVLESSIHKICSLLSVRVGDLVCWLGFWAGRQAGWQDTQLRGH
jgi:hypothetical protein